MNIESAKKACEEEPSLIFELIRNGEIELVDKLISKNKVSINTLDEAGNDVITRLLKAKEYELVLKLIKRTDWDINHQNYDGNTFAHYLVSINYVEVVDIIKTLRRKRSLLLNIKNNKGETILDKAINENYIYTTLKIIEDKRFNSIDVVSFKKIFNAYIKSRQYGKYSKLSNLNIIVGSLEKKELLPSMKLLLSEIRKNKEIIRKEIMRNKSKYLEGIINNVLLQASI